MNAALSPAIGASESPPPFATRLTETIDAWHSLERWHWAAALGVGSVLGLGYGLYFVAQVMGSPLPDVPVTAVLAAVMLHAITINSLAAVLLMLGLAALDRHDGVATPRPRAYVLLVAVVALTTGFLDRPWGLLVDAVINVLGVPIVESAPPSSLRGVVLESFGTALQHLIALLPATLCYLYLRNARRSAGRLASTQLRHAEVERRLLAERLEGAQALVEPAFLFDTLRLAEELYEHDAKSGHRLLGELIAYLRAALPPLYGNGSTVGQQAEMVRAYLQIERIRLGGGLNPRIDVPAELADRPFAPLLLLPLATHAVREGIEPCAGGDVVLRAQVLNGWLTVEVADSGPARADSVRQSAGLAGVRERLERLYGDGARLTLADVAPRGFAARLEVAAGAVA